MADGRAAPIELDGSQGEGGGQVLRTALSLSLVTGRPFHITRLRAHRSQPGLRPQHLACVRGAEALSGSTSEGATLGSPELRFFPSPVRPGSYLLEVGTAGSTTLLLQCLFYPLALAGGGELTLRGGTHVPHSPASQYLAWAWLPALGADGLRAELRLRHAGFYPEGAGELWTRIPERASPPDRVVLGARGALRDVHVASLVGGLPFELAERQGRAAVTALRERGIYAELEKLALPVTRSAGSLVLVRAEFERSIAAFSALGERGHPVEDVGREAASRLFAFLESNGAIEEHLADQLLLPAALLASGRLGPTEPGTTHFHAAKVTGHLTTHAAVLEQFLPVKIAIAAGGEVTVSRSA